MATNGAVNGGAAVLIAKAEVLHAMVGPVGNEEAEPVGRDLQAVWVVDLARETAPGA